VAQSTIIRYLAIVLGTVLWDVGAVLQKQAVGRMPAGRLPVLALIGSASWMLGLFVTAAGWGMFVFGLDQVSISAARMVTAGSYVVLAVFSTVFLRTPLSPVEWAALGCVTVGILLLGLQESSAAGPLIPPTNRVILGVASIAVLSLIVSFAPRFLKGLSRASTVALFVFSALSGLLGSVGDLLTKVFLALFQAQPVPVASLTLVAAGFIAFYLAGFYMLSRAYQAGTVVGGVVVSDFFGRVGVLFLGSLVLSEPIGGPAGGGLLRAVGFLLVLGGSLLLGRFAAASEGSKPSQAARTRS
jgi:drug/metabolite transporter (DMT)-like permease